MKNKLLFYLVTLLISIGLTLAVSPFIKRFLDHFMTTESDATIEAAYLISFVLLFSAFKELVETVLKRFKKHE